MLRRLLTLGIVASGWLVFGLAATADAEVTGPCTGQGTFESQGTSYDANTADKVVLPAKDTVAYTGAIATDEPNDRSHRGHISVKLPPPLPDIEVADWATDDTDAVDDAGVYDYDLPFIVPRGVSLNLTGEHVDTAGTCTGDVEIEIEGGPFDAPLPTIISIALTIGAGSMVWVAGKVR